ncbi:hypothetical protein KIW84_053422 [Lathyrus oleraceus]|uniref:Uncharacterized protein n=1 Tax=Pisum sativum TaxID=3888 RepID=A0A9D4WT68_PEA|nr:hypothetical protein KIW84_053422 [Pisum sativum]
MLSNINNRSFLFLKSFVLNLLRNQRSEPVYVHNWGIEFVTKLVKVSHTNLTEITWMVLVEEDPVVVHASSVTATSGMLSVLSDTTVTGTDMTSLLPVLLESGCHLRLLLSVLPLCEN